MRRYAAALVVCILLSACASTKPVNMAEARRVVGTDNDVRVDAEIYGDQLGPNVTLPVKYDVTNHRQTTILIADLIPECSYDDETHTVTVSIGAEIPGQEFLPRLIPVRSGERKSFSTSAHVYIRQMFGSPWVRRPDLLRVKLNFLDNAVAFEKLVAIPERAVHDPALAAELFPKWVEGNETVITNSLPMRWISGIGEEPTPALMPGSRRGHGP